MIRIIVNYGIEMVKFDPIIWVTSFCNFFLGQSVSALVGSFSSIKFTEVITFLENCHTSKILNIQSAGKATVYNVAIMYMDSRLCN